jgi:hypothetical protein
MISIESASPMYPTAKNFIPRIFKLFFTLKLINVLSKKLEKIPMLMPMKFAAYKLTPAFRKSKNITLSNAAQDEPIMPYNVISFISDKGI